jgi:uncharacterized OB-fold protein
LSASELEIQRCEACGACLFPARLRCPTCGGVRLAAIPAGPGLVEEETRLLHPPGAVDGPVQLGSIRLRSGPVVIARLDEGAGVGAAVRLELVAGGTIWARAGTP